MQTALDNATNQGLTAADVAAMDVAAIAELDGVPVVPPEGWSAEVVRATVVNTLASREAEAMREAARCAAEAAARAVLPDVEVEVR